jgi:hypothetical protein
MKDTLCFRVDHMSTSAFHCSSVIVPNGEVVLTWLAGIPLKHFFFNKYLIFHCPFLSKSMHAYSTTSLLVGQ